MPKTTDPTREDRAAAYQHIYGRGPRPDSWEAGWIDDQDSEPERGGPTSQLQLLADHIAATRAQGVTTGYLSAVVTLLRTPPIDWDLAHKVLRAGGIKPSDVRASGFSRADRTLLMGALKVKL